MLSMIVGGLAGSASAIAGSLGKTLAYLTFDEEYRKVGNLLCYKTNFCMCAYNAMTLTCWIQPSFPHSLIHAH